MSEPIRTPGGFETHERLVTIPVFPLYSKTRSLLSTLHGVRRADFTHLLNSIWDQTGTPQDPVDWTEPSKWIPERLPREDQGLATRIWEESGRTLNPRHLRGPGFLINGYVLALPDASGVYRITPTGRKFLAEDPETLRQIDRREGLLQLLAILAPKARAKRADLLPAWTEFLYSNSNYRTDTTISYTLYGRIANLIERGFVDRDGNTYTITGKGIDYASQAPTTKPDPKREVLKALVAYNAEQRAALKERLIKVSPWRFEALVGQLLLAMGYEDVEITKASGDLGVDVKARMEMGITTVTEVVQVKRRTAPIGRPVVDQLRGVLPLHGAFRGTIMTLGKFSHGCEEVATFRGAAPITLIDGERLLDLLIDNNLGIKKRQAAIYELDESFFADEPRVAEDPAGLES